MRGAQPNHLLLWRGRAPPCCCCLAVSQAAVDLPLQGRDRKPLLLLLLLVNIGFDTIKGCQCPRETVLQSHSQSECTLSHKACMVKHALIHPCPQSRHVDIC